MAFDTIPSGIDESAVVLLDPQDLVSELARRKAREVAQIWPDRPVLGADTLVVAAGTVLGKPSDDADATRMLRAMRDSVIEVITGVSLWVNGVAHEATETSRVSVAPFSEAELVGYLATGVHHDKAGALAVQHRNPSLTRQTYGCETNIVGLPMCVVERLLNQAEVVSTGRAWCCDTSHLVSRH